MRARRLKNLRVKRVDLVGRGANQMADVVLFKSAEPPMDKPPMCKCGEPMKSYEKMCAKCAKEAEVTKAAEAAKEKHMETTEQIKKLEGDLKAASELAEEEAKKREAVEKSLKDQGDQIAALKKQLDDSATEIKKAQDAAKLVEFKKAVDAFEHLPVKADVFGPILKACNEALDEAGYAELMRVLKAADAASGENFAEIGAPGGGTSARSATEELAAKAEELVTKSAGKLPEHEALAKAAAMNPKLADRARRESYAARSEN